MKCPNDETTLLITERKGIEIDYCPTCRGVWLDKGELDKLIQGSENGHTPPMQTHAPQGQYQQSNNYQEQRPQNHNNYPYKKKRESFLGEIFDF